MRNPMIIGTLGGLLFGIVLIWQGAGAAGLVLLYALVGWLLGAAIWVAKRWVNGEIDTDSVRELVDAIFNGRARQ